MLFDAQGERLTPSHTVKSGRRYRYYVSAALITEAGTDRAHGWRLAAREIEGAVIKILVDALTNPGIARDLDQCTGEQVARRDRGLCPLAGGWHRQPQLWHTRVLAHDKRQMRLRHRGTDGLSTHRWRKPDSNSRSHREGKAYAEPLQASIAVSDLNL